MKQAHFIFNIIIFLSVTVEAQQLMYLENSNNANPLIQQMVDDVSRDSLLKYVLALQAFNTRYEYTAQQEFAASYILNQFNSWGVQAESDWYVFGWPYFYDLDMISKDTIWIVGSWGTIVRYGEWWYKLDCQSESNV